MTTLRYPDTMTLLAADDTTLITGEIGPGVLNHEAVIALVLQLAPDDRSRIAGVEHRFDGGSRSGHATVFRFPWDDGWRAWAFSR